MSDLVDKVLGGERISPAEGLQLHQEADLATLGLTIMPERAQVVDFSMCVFTDSITLFVSKTDKRSVNVWVYMEIFAIASWVVLLATFWVLAGSFKVS